MNIILKLVCTFVIALFTTTSTTNFGIISKEEQTIIECNYFLGKMQNEAWSYKNFNDRITALPIFPVYGGTLYGFVAYSASCFIPGPAPLFITALAGLYGSYNCNKAKIAARKSLDTFEQRKEHLLREKEAAKKAFKERILKK